MKNGLRFKLGDVVYFAVARGMTTIELVGCKCEIAAVGPWPAGANCSHEETGPYRTSREHDYVIRFYGKTELKLLVSDWQLRKLNHPAEPAAMKRRENKA